MGAGEEAQGYLNTVDRMEKDIHPVDLPAAAASIAISLKRIANALEGIAKTQDRMLGLYRSP